MSESMTLMQSALVGGTRLGGTGTTYTAGALTSISDSVTNAADQLYALTVDVTQITALFIVAAAAMTLEWNDAAGTQGEIILAANVPISWSSADTDDVHPNPFLSVDLTALYITNASGASAQFDLRIIVDPTV